MAADLSGVAASLRIGDGGAGIACTAAVTETPTMEANGFDGDRERRDLNRRQGGAAAAGACGAHRRRRVRRRAAAAAEARV